MSSLAVVCIDGRPGRESGALVALRHCADQVCASEVLLFTPSCPPGLPQGIRHIPVAPLGYLDYSAFVLYGLKDFVKTSHVLVVQSDGWILNGACWHKDFPECDYIGAPTHTAMVGSGPGVRLMERCEWLAAPSGVSTRPLLNGGFSLRSRRLLGAPARLGLSMRIPPCTLTGQPLAMRVPGDAANEDFHLCFTWRDELEADGLVFATPALASRFSVEQILPGLHDSLDPAKVFGQHNHLRRLTRLSPPTVTYPFPQSEVGRVYGESRMLNALARLGYSVEFPPEEKSTEPHANDLSPLPVA